MQDRSTAPSFTNILLFVVIAILALVVYPMAMEKWFPAPKKPPRAPAANEKQDKEEAEKRKEEKLVAKKPEKAPLDDKPDTPPLDPEAVGQVKAEEPVKDQDPRGWITLGSVDPDGSNPYRMLITLSRRGGAMARLELSSDRYRDLDDRSGYLGHLVMDGSGQGRGCLVQVVGTGTPAAKADIRRGDRILEITRKGTKSEIDGPAALNKALHKTRPDETIEVRILRGEDESTRSVTLIRRPLEVIRPERKMPSIIWTPGGSTDAIDLDANSPQSFLTTLQQVDADDKLRADEDPNAKMEEELARELPGVNLRDADWRIESPTAADEDRGPIEKVVFSCIVPKHRLKITKTYELKPIADDASGKPDDRGYHLVLSVAVTNNDAKKHDVACRLDGPNGLPVEGDWYAAYKVGRTWSTEGLRDVVYQLKGQPVNVATCMQLAEKYRKEIGEATQFGENPPVFFGVDAQYFSVAMIPDQATVPGIDRAVALRVGDVEPQRKTSSNVTFRLIGKPVTLEPGATHEQRFTVFAGPKRPPLLAKYNLSGMICYGWTIFQMVAVPMTWILETFFSFVHNYGLAIIMLTVVVRLAMFPMSCKQAKNAQMMQKLQPEMKEIQKKFKKDPEGARKAQQELFAKHNYNPLGGCLLLLIQMPIFLGLYRALQVDVELRDAPLLSHSVRWCSNLAAPDMLLDWSWIMPNSVTNGIGFTWLPLFGPLFGLGPYLNLFPIITLALFQIQQKVMMPPPADEQAAAQQKMMKYMMFLMGIMFFKVAAGLCIYFIASTLWGLAERQFLPKAAEGNGKPAAGNSVAPVRLTAAERENIRRKKRGEKK